MAEHASGTKTRKSFIKRTFRVNFCGNVRTRIVKMKRRSRMRRLYGSGQKWRGRAGQKIKIKRRKLEKEETSIHLKWKEKWISPSIITAYTADFSAICWKEKSRENDGRRGSVKFTGSLHQTDIWWLDLLRTVLQMTFEKKYCYDNQTGGNLKHSNPIFWTHGNPTKCKSKLLN